MPTIEAVDARARFDELLSDVEGGETIVVTVRGMPVARIVPIEQRFKDAAAAIDDWMRYRKLRNITLGEGITIRELVDGDRDRRLERITRSGGDENDRGE